MMNYYIGIDFGTTNSSVAYVFDDGDEGMKQPRPESIKFERDDGSEDNRLPSLVVQSMKNNSHALVAGWDAWGQIHRLSTQRRRGSMNLLRHGNNLFRSMKSDLGSGRVYPYSCAADVRTPEAAVTVVFRELIGAAQRAKPELKMHEVPVVISVPASLSAASRQETLNAAIMAGLPPDNIELIDEPIAALLHALGNRETASQLLPDDEPRNILVYDYGGGTLDLCLVRCRRDKSAVFGFDVEHLAISHYLRNGGNDIDRAIMQEVLWPQILSKLDVERSSIPLPTQHAIEDTFTGLVARQLKEQMCVWVTKELKGKDMERIPDRTFKHIEVLKLAIRFEDTHLPKAIPVDFSMTLNNFMEVIEDFTTVPYGEKASWSVEFPRSIFLPIFDTVAKAEMTMDEVHALLIHGGSCRNPLVRASLEETFSRDDDLFRRMLLVPSPSLNTSVAEGAALACWWRKARHIDPVHPIISECVGIMDRADIRHYLVPTNYRLPYPSEDGWSTAEGLFCIPEKDAPMMFVPWFTGNGDEPAHIIRLDLSDLSGLNKNDSVTIECRIDRDKVLHWRYRIKDGPFRVADCIEDPWMLTRPTPEQRVLSEHRRKMQSWVATNPNKPIPKDFLFNEANYCRLADDFDTAELLALDYLDSYGEDPCILNILSIMCNNSGRSEMALLYSEKIAKLSPRNAIFVGNYGYHLADAGKNAEAEAVLRQAITLRNDLDYVHTRLGRLLAKMGRPDEAKAEFMRSLQILEKKIKGPTQDSQDFASAKTVYRNLGDYNKAKEYADLFEKARHREMMGGDEKFVIATYQSESM